MSRSPQFPVEQKIRIVLSILAGETSIAEAARKNKVTETTIGRWKTAFLEGGKNGLMPRPGGRTSSREARLESEIEQLKTALGEAHVELRVWKKSADYLPPFRTLK